MPGTSLLAAEQCYVHRRQKVSGATRLDSGVGAACAERFRATDARAGGFPRVLYYLLGGGPDALITISMFDSADEALMSNEKAVDWVRNNVMEFARGMPEIMVGDVLVAEVKRPLLTLTVGNSRRMTTKPASASCSVR